MPFANAKKEETLLVMLKARTRKLGLEFNEYLWSYASAAKHHKAKGNEELASILEAASKRLKEINAPKRLSLQEELELWRKKTAGVVTHR